MLPLFPLPVVLFPGAYLPLHIFEPRYRAMLADAVAGDHRFGLVEPDPDGGAAPGGLGTVARIRAVEPFPDGRSNIVVSGEHRFTVRTVVPSEHPYLVAQVDRYEDEPDVQVPAPLELERLTGLAERYARALALLTDGEREFELTEEPGRLTFQIAGLLEWSFAARLEFLRSRSAAARVARLLHELPRLCDEIEPRARVHVRAATNGSGHR